MDGSDSWRLPDSFSSSGDPCDGNPFPPNNQRHEVWAAATKRAEEKWARESAQLMGNLAPHNAHEWFPTLHATRFSVWAERGVHVIWSDKEVELFDGWLLNYANAILDDLAAFFERRPPPLPADGIIVDVRNRLAQQVQLWKAEARRYRAAQEVHRSRTSEDEVVATAALVKRRNGLIREYRQRHNIDANGLLGGRE
jgi:hypothetical protein